MGDLQEHRWSAPQERDEWRVAESPDHAIRHEVAIPAFQSLRMGGRARLSCSSSTLCHPHRMPKARKRPPARPSVLICGMLGGARRDLDPRTRRAVVGLRVRGRGGMTRKADFTEDDWRIVL